MKKLLFAVTLLIATTIAAQDYNRFLITKFS